VKDPLVRVTAPAKPGKVVFGIIGPGGHVTPFSARLWRKTRDRVVAE
jgi:hypothetical protein